MKKIVTLLVLGISFFGFSQEKEVKKCAKDSTCCKSNVKVHTYIGIGAQIHDDYKLNSNFRSQNLPEIKTTMPEFVVGLNFFDKKFSADLELGLLYSKSSKDGNENKYYGVTGRFKYHYNIINKEKVAFTGGLSLSGTSATFDVYSQSNIIDFNDLTPNNNGGHINLKNSMYYVGPSVSLYLFRKSFPIKVNAAYELAFTRGRWKSDFGAIANGVNESGNNRFVVGVTLL
jgi:hypothetical protein